MQNGGSFGSLTAQIAAMVEIGGIVPFTTIDYPGKLAAVIFCQGCPWRCGYCHNRHLIPATSDAAVPWQEIVTLLRKRVGLLDAVVFSGGEPTMQSGLATVMGEVKRMGFLIGLHTSGAFPETLEQALPLTDWIGMDIKAPFDEYKTITGVAGSGEAARVSAAMVKRSGIAHSFRTTLDHNLLGKHRLEKLRHQVLLEFCAEIETQQVALCG